MIPPALGIPYWRETRPTCVGMTAEETQELTEYKDSRLGCPRHDFCSEFCILCWNSMAMACHGAGLLLHELGGS